MSFPWRWTRCSPEVSVQQTKSYQNLSDHTSSDVLGDAQSELRDLEAEMAPLVHQLVSLNDKRTRHLTRMDKLRPAIAWHKYLPSEILAEIFVHCLDDIDTAVEIESCGLPGGTPDIPWSLGHVCSRWRQIALTERRLWNSIQFSATVRHVAALQEAFRRSAQSPLRLFVQERHRYIWQTFIHDIVVPQSHRIRDLSLDLTPGALCDFLRLPQGLFDAIETLRLSAGVLPTMRAKDACVFRGNYNLRRIQLACDSACRDEPPLPFPGFPLPLDLPWFQLTHFDMKTILIDLLIAHELLNRCANLQECHLRLCNREDFRFDEGLPVAPNKVYLRGSIHLPHLRKLYLCVGDGETPDLYRDCLQALVLPFLDEFSFVLDVDQPSWSPAGLTALIDCIPHDSAHFILDYLGDGDFGEIAKPLSFLTSISAIHAFLSKSTIQSIGQGVFPNLTSLSTDVHFGNLDDFLAMLTARRTTLRFGTIYVYVPVPDRTLKLLNQLEEHRTGSEIELRLAP